MTEPSSAIGCVFAILAVIGGLFLHLLFAATVYMAIPILGLILALRIWTLDRRSGLFVLVASTLVLLFASYVANAGLEMQVAWAAHRPHVIAAYALLVAVEMSIYVIRANSDNPAYQKAGRAALVIALLSMGIGLLLAYLSNL